MHKRFWLICSVIGIALLVLSVLGLWSLGMHEKGIRAERQQEFVSVAEQIRFEVKKSLDAFMQTEQDRPYTDYQALYVPETMNQASALVRSPLAGSLDNGLAYGYFQLDSTGLISTPYVVAGQVAPSRDVQQYLANLDDNLLPSLATGESMQIRRIEPSEPKIDDSERKRIAFNDLFSRDSRPRMDQEYAYVPTEAVPALEEEAVSKKVTPKSKGAGGRRSTYPISSFDEAQQAPRTQRQSRSTYEQNIYSNTAAPMRQETIDDDLMMGMQGLKKVELPTEGQSQNLTDKEEKQDRSNETQTEMTSESEKVSQEQRKESQWLRTSRAKGAKMPSQMIEQIQEPAEEVELSIADVQSSDVIAGMGLTEDSAVEGQTLKTNNRRSANGDTVQIRIEPFVPMTVPDENGGQRLFAGQVFLMRHIQIEELHLLQGFRLNENELLAQVRQSARQLIRRGMGFDISDREREDAAYTAVLDFGFGEVVLNLMEQQPNFIQGRVDRLRNWCFAILAVVWLAVVIALATFWRNMHEQVQLSRKKDDFISAVSHELRTPLTSIRMYTEMLEKDWVKTDEKRKEYYATMRQESERLSRLIENVLDFSRIQRGRKRYEFNAGDVNQCVADVMEMMAPYVARAGFTMESDFKAIEPFTFDRDAVVQIVINLLDNALKYARQSEDKRIMVRTRMQSDYVVIEVEDRGPGIDRSQQNKIFEAFYRCGDESTRQATGTGLGLALVKRFAEAHHGFVEILNAKPKGALFRVGLANHFGK